jgi:hypothetical protein
MPDGLLRRLLRRIGGSDEPVRIERALRDLSAAQQRDTAVVESRLKALAALVAQRSSAKDSNEILHSVWALQSSIEQPGAAAHTDAGSEQPIDLKLLRELEAVARGDAPIVVGPWTGEVGFELLYWAPFVEWFRARWRVPPERFVIVSRGGVESWYAIAGARYVDIFSLLPPAAFVERAAGDKQRDVSDFDRELLEMVSVRCSITGGAHLHPRLMYRALSPFWRDQAGFGLVERFTAHRRLDAPDDPVLRTLPDAYVAVRFYTSGCFPDKEKNRTAARDAVAALAQQLPVVVIDSGLRIDDHQDYGAGEHPRVIAVGAGVPPERNLAVQTAVIARARAFVGTYGGYAYLAPFLGVPAVGLYSERSFKLHHLHAAQRVLERLGSATVIAVDVAQAGTVHAVTAGL